MSHGSLSGRNGAELWIVGCGISDMNLRGAEAMEAVVSGRVPRQTAPLERCLRFAKRTVLLEVADQCGRHADKRHQGSENKQIV